MNESIPAEDMPCPLGCARNDRVILTGRDLLHDQPGEFTVVKCGTCGLMRTNPRPTPETIDSYYPDDYGPFAGSRVRETGTRQTPRIKKMFKPLVKRLFNFNTNRVPPVSPGRMLEVGCASGAFLHHMSGLGWQVEGIELSAKAAQSAMKLGYSVHAGPLETAPEPRQPFDLIVGWMVLEHLHDPLDCLRKLSAWVNPGGWLVLSVPNAASLEFSLFKDKWYALQVPTHLYHFTPESLERVLRAGGWRLEKVLHQRVLSNLFGSIGYLLRDKGYSAVGQKLLDVPGKAGLKHYYFYPLSFILGLLGQTGRMTVWARKAE